MGTADEEKEKSQANLINLSTNSNNFDVLVTQDNDMPSNSASALKLKKMASSNRELLQVERAPKKDKFDRKLTNPYEPQDSKSSGINFESSKKSLAQSKGNVPYTKKNLLLQSNSRSDLHRSH